jgi:hypothetical protein
MHPSPAVRRAGSAAAALALVVVLGACVCFDPTIRFDLDPVAPAAAGTTVPVATRP